MDDRNWRLTVRRRISGAVWLLLLVLCSLSLLFCLLLFTRRLLLVLLVLSSLRHFYHALVSSACDYISFPKFVKLK